MSITATGERPRTVGPARAAAILYGDWGTSKAYTLGIAFALAGYSSFPLLAAMSALTAVVGLNYYWVCCQYPDGGGVYSAVRERSRLFAIVGALLLTADYLVTASLSVLEGFNYIAHLLEQQFGFHLAHLDLWTIGLISTIGLLNWWGPRHSGSFAVALAVPASLAAMTIAVLALPYLGQARFEPSPLSFGGQWMQFAGIVLALSGVEAVSNMTGVMTADPRPDSSGRATVRRTSAWAISVVAAEVVILTVVLSWAMHAVPGLNRETPDAMLGQMAGYFGGQTFGPAAGTIYSTIVGLVMAVLLFSAGNTAIIGMISVLYMMAKDHEMPDVFSRLNRHGVPTFPLIVSAIAPCALLLFFNRVHALAALYAIGVVGAITINLAACSTNRRLRMNGAVRAIMGATALVTLAIWITIAFEKHEALIFAIVILAMGLLARSFVHERRQTKAEAEMRDLLASEFQNPETTAGAPRILVSVRGVTDTLRFAADEARAHKGRLGVLFVREVNVLIPVEMAPENDPEARRIIEAVRSVAHNVPVEFLYRASDNTGQTILQVLRDWKADYYIMGASAEGAIGRLLRGSIVQTVSEHLPRRTKLLIYSWRPRRAGKPDPTEAESET